MSMRERIFATSLIDLADETSAPGIVKRPSDATGITRSWSRDPNQEPHATVTGHYSKAEDIRLMECIEEYCSDNSISIDDVSAYLDMGRDDRMKEKQKHGNTGIRGIWMTVAESFPHRSVVSISHRGERMLGHQGGEWKEHDRRELMRLVKVMGQKWRKIGHILERNPTSCQVKYWRLEAGKAAADELIGGRFTPDEVKRLVHLVEKYSNKSKAGEMADGSVSMFPTTGIPWPKIARKMDRTVNALTRKWYFEVHRQLSGFGREAWGDPEDDALLQAIVDTDAEDQDEVPWSALPLRTTAATAKQRWLQLAKTVARSHMMSFEQIVMVLDGKLRARAGMGETDTDANDTAGDDDDEEEEDDDDGGEFSGLAFSSAACSEKNNNNNDDENDDIYYMNNNNNSNNGENDHYHNNNDTNSNTNYYNSNGSNNNSNSSKESKTHARKCSVKSHQHLKNKKKRSLAVTTDEKPQKKHKSKKERKSKRAKREREITEIKDDNESDISSSSLEEAEEAEEDQNGCYSYIVDTSNVNGYIRGGSDDGYIAVDSYNHYNDVGSMNINKVKSRMVKPCNIKLEESEAVVADVERRERKRELAAMEIQEKAVRKQQKLERKQEKCERKARRMERRDAKVQRKKMRADLRRS